HFGDNDDEADNENQGDKDHGEDMEDEDDIFDDGPECDIFLQQDFDNYQGEGGSDKVDFRKVVVDNVPSREQRYAPNATSTNIITDNEIQESMDIGSSIGYDLAGKEEMVRQVIGAEIESKYNKDDSSFIHSLWGFRSCGFAIKKSDGNSGGIIAIWNKSMFMEQKIVYGDGFLAVYGQWIHFNTPCLMIVLYAP
ncbi:hypothetical protein Tco_1372217, partial [Tanacetum coccineum]